MKILGAAAAIFLLALVPRLAALDAYVTIDESRWVQRAADFYALLSQRDPEDTFIIGHPGVTTMWTALAGMGPEQALRFSFREGRTDVTRRDGYLDALIAARRPFAVLAAAGAAAVALLGWRLLGPGPALIGGALLALEPFLVAHAQVVHLDSALATYTAICLLAGLIWAQAGGGIGYLLLSGVAGGLAFLTKAPSVFVLGFVPLIVLVGLFRSARRPPEWARSALFLVLWGGVASAVCLTLWPALRANPVGTLLKMAQFTERVGGGDHDNFFFGQVLENPGPFFYPVALLYRLAPLTLIGIALALVGWCRLTPEHRRSALTLGLYCLGFGLMMSVAPKKFDRYLLPIFPVLGLIAGLGVWTFARRVVSGPHPNPLPEGEGADTRSLWERAKDAGSPTSASRVRATPRPTHPGTHTSVPSASGRSAAIALTLALLALQAAPLVTVYPYALAYYNPLLGGGATAQRAILVGWGEGLDQVARYLNGQPRGLGAPTVATSYHRVLQAQLDGSALPLERVRMADYVVPYVNTLQRSAEQEVLQPYLTDEPIHAVRINGIEYARVYRGPHFPLGATLGADFGGRATLVDYLGAPGSGRVRVGDEIEVVLRWDRAPSGNERVGVQMLDPAGRVVVQDERPIGADGPNEAGRPGEIHRLTVPPRTPVGEYRLAVRVTGPSARATIRPAHAESDSLELRTVVVEAGP